MTSEPEWRRWEEMVPGNGRVDVNGVEWFACDPYPTWFRWEGKTLHRNPARFVDQAPTTADEPLEEDYGHELYGTRPHRPDCDRKIKARWSGVACDCNARWFCY